MILAAGRGERMRPLTDNCPKPLLKVAGVPLIEHHIVKLAAAGFKDIIINHAWLGHKIEEYLGNGERWDVTITYSREGSNALETAGGIIKALPMLCELGDRFLVINGDIYTHYDFSKVHSLLIDKPALGALSINKETPETLAHLWLVPNPQHNVKGDFELNEQLVSVITGSSLIDNVSSTTTYTFSGIALYHKDFFKHNELIEGINKIRPLGPLLRTFAALGKISGEVLNEKWVDVGTPERLNILNREERNS